jgi:DNA-binding IclR family transcriptional regulator
MLSMMRNTNFRNEAHEPSSRRQGVQAIARAAALLRALEHAPEGLPLGRLAAAVELPKSTVHRLVGALAEEDLVTYDWGGDVRLGAALVRLGAAGREALPDRLRPLLLDLRQALEETVDLSVLDGPSVRFVDQVPAPHRLRATSAVGERFPLHCTANGKALLAAMPAVEVATLLPKRLQRLTPHTIVTHEALLAELEQVRTHGVAFDREEHTEGICAAGVAIVDAGRPIAAISVPVPVQRFHGREDELAAQLHSAAVAGSKLL